MWLMTSFGILMPAERPAKYTPDWDERRLQIRSRRAHELDILRDKYMRGTLGDTIYTPEKDYEYRAYCTHEDWALACAAMMREIDYTKFKPTTHRYHDNELHSVYNAIWSVVINRLSTKRHQEEYWRLNGRDDWDWRPGLESQPTSANGWNRYPVEGSKKAGGAGASSQTGWPKKPDLPPKLTMLPTTNPDDVRPRSPQFSGGAAEYGNSVEDSDWRDCRQPMPSHYGDTRWDNPGYDVDGFNTTMPDRRGDVTYYVAPGTDKIERRSTAADRDQIEPEVWETPTEELHLGEMDADGLSDEDWASLNAVLDRLPVPVFADSVQAAMHGMDIVDRARLEVDELTRSLGDRMDHAECEHGWGPGARRTCRERFNRGVLARIEEIEDLIKEVEDKRRNEAPALTSTK